MIPPPPPGLQKSVFALHYKKSSQQKTTSQFLCNVFHVLNLCGKQKNPSLQKQINYSVENIVPQPRPPKKVINFQMSYPLNKSGAFGTLVRQCWVKGKGIEEKDGKKAPVYKEICWVKSSVQTEKTKNNEKLEWIKESKLYPYRLIVKDSKNSIKAIYFKTKSQAETIRIHFISVLNIKTNLLQLFKNCQQKLTLKTAEAFKLKLSNCQKSQRKNSHVEDYLSSINSEYLKMQAQATNFKSSEKWGHRASVKNVGQMKEKTMGLERENQREGGKEREREREREGLFENQKFQGRERESEIENSVVENILNSNTFKGKNGFDTDVVKLLADRGSRREEEIRINGSIFGKLENYWKKDLFLSWKQKAHEARQNDEDERMIQDEEQSIGGVHLFDSKAKRNQSYSQLGNSKITYSAAPKNSTSNLHRSILDSQKTPSHYQPSNLPLSTAKPQTRSNLLLPSLPNPQKSPSPSPSSLLTPSAIPSCPPSSLTLTLKSIQFLEQTNIFIKPIIIATLFKDNEPLQEIKFNTMIQKKQPHLCYELIPPPSIPPLHPSPNMQSHSLCLKCFDFLSNTIISQCNISFNHKIISNNTLLMDKDKNVRVLLSICGEQGEEIEQGEGAQGCYLDLPDLPQNLISQIRRFWSHQSSKRNYYQVDNQVSVTEVLKLYQVEPRAWMLGLGAGDYKVITMVNSASKILGFRMGQFMIDIVRVLQHLYPQIPQLLSSTLSIISNHLPPLLHPPPTPSLLQKHLNIDTILDCSDKTFLEIQVLRQIVCMECLWLKGVGEGKGVVLWHLLYQYTYRLLSPLFPLHCLLQLWAYFFESKDVLLLGMLGGVYLCKAYQVDLEGCHSLKQAVDVLESKKITSAEIVIKEISLLHRKYFGGKGGVFESLRGMFVVRPFQGVIQMLDKRVSQRVENQRKEMQKNRVLTELCKQKNIELPVYPPKKYTLHIYFYSLPSNGTLSLRTKSTTYQCLNIPKIRYFIIGSVDSEISVEYESEQGQLYQGVLGMWLGGGKGILRLKGQGSKGNKEKKEIIIEYICGLLTQGQIQGIKKGKKFEHYISSFVKQEELFDQFLRPIQQCAFLKSYEGNDLGKKIRNLFSSGNQNFDQIEFYLRWICVSSLTLPEKLKLVQNLAMNVSQEHFLSYNQELSKILHYRFLKMCRFPIDPLSYKCYYSNSQPEQFASPKIIKCQASLPPHTHPLCPHISQYLHTRIQNYFVEDINFNDFLKNVTPTLSKGHGKGEYSAGQHGGSLPIATTVRGVLEIVYASFGFVKSVEIPIIKRPSDQYFVIEDSHFQVQSTENNDIATVQPEILVAEALPTFSKISTILDFVNTSHNPSPTPPPKHKLPQQINLLKYFDSKLHSVLTLRYSKGPETINIPFLRYYHQLLWEQSCPPIPKNLFLNNLQTDLQTICTHPLPLTLSDNKKIPVRPLLKTMGLYANLRHLPRVQNLFFNTVYEEPPQKPNAKVFVNWGFGVLRWEPCIVKGYCMIKKPKQKSQQKYYLVETDKQTKLFRDFQIKITPQVDQSLPYIDANKLGQSRVGSIQKVNEASQLSRSNVRSQKGVEYSRKLNF